MPWSGLEPLRLSAPPPQDGVSTNFTTRAKRLRTANLPVSCSLFPVNLLFGSSFDEPITEQPKTGNLQQETGNANGTSTGPTGLEPATSRVTVECSNQTELRPLIHDALLHCAPSQQKNHSPKGNRTPLCTVKGCRPNRSTMGPTTHSANGIRTRVWALRGPRPSPLDDSAANVVPKTRSPEV